LQSDVTPDDPTDGYAALEAQHRELERAFERLRHDDETPLLDELTAEVTRHVRVEAAAALPLLRKYVDDGDDLADLVEREHAAALDVVERVRAAPASGGDRATDPTDRVAGLRAVVEAHIARAETEVFPAMRSCGVSGAQLGRAVADLPTA
jgi:hypothetical protein